MHKGEIVIQRLKCHTITRGAQAACSPNNVRAENNETEINSRASLDSPQLSSSYFDLSDLMWLLDTTQATDAIKVNEFVVRQTRHSSYQEHDSNPPWLKCISTEEL